MSFSDGFFLNLFGRRVSLSVGEANGDAEATKRQTKGGMHGAVLPCELSCTAEFAMSSPCHFSSSTGSGSSLALRLRHPFRPQAAHNLSGLPHLACRNFLQLLLE